MAGEALGLGARDLLHAGPPIQDPRNACAPVVNSVISAILFEGWAGDPHQALAMYRNGEVRLQPAQDHGCVVPLADVLSPSIWVQQVRDAAGRGEDRFSPLNAGMIHPQRVGVFSMQVVEQLRWMNTQLARTLQRALERTHPQGLDLLGIADDALTRGDDLHANNTQASALLLQQLAPGLRGGEDHAVQAFLGQAAPFFLNLWMATCSCLLSAARDVPGCAIVTAAGGNGQDFGIQLASAPGRWSLAPGLPPTPTQPPDQGVPLPAIGDSAIVDLAGFGAMTSMAAATRSAPFATLWPRLAGIGQQLLGGPHPGLPHTQARVGTSARSIRDHGVTPIIALGILDAEGELGRIAGGFYCSPPAVYLDCLTELEP